MAARKPYIGGNWKMNLHVAQADVLAHKLAQRFSRPEPVDLVICPAFPHLQKVGGVLRDANSSIRLGAQDFYHEPNGAFTGEVSLSMLEDVGVSAVLVGHSERRHVLKEQNQLVNAKCLAALNAWMQVIFCVGEKIEHRESNQMERVITDQLSRGLEGVTSEQMAQVTIAYEPVWAIGTGHAATPADAQAAHTAIRNHLAKMFGHLLAQTVRIQYGGSVNPKNAAELFAQPDVDGFLVGGASLVTDHFLAIIDVAR